MSDIKLIQGYCTTSENIAVDILNGIERREFPLTASIKSLTGQELVEIIHLVIDNYVVQPFDSIIKEEEDNEK